MAEHPAPRQAEPGHPDGHPFDVDTHLTPAGDGFDVQVSDRWTINTDQANGGYGLALCLRALARTTPFPDPLVLSATYLRPLRVGPAHVAVEPIRAGRRMSSGEARLLQGGRESVRLVATFADLATATGPTVVRGGPPDLPPPEQCLPLNSGATIQGTSIIDRVEFRAPQLPGFATGAPSGVAEFSCWMRMSGGREIDTLALACMVDMAPPAAFELGHYTSTSLELTVHVRQRPVPGWLACHISTRFMIDGYHDEDVEVWDSEGRLVAQSRQLQLLI